MVNSGSLGCGGGSTPDWRFCSGRRGGFGGGSLSPSHNPSAIGTMAYRYCHTDVGHAHLCTSVAGGQAVSGHGRVARSSLMLRGVGVWLPHFHWLITMQKHNHHLSCAIRIGEETGRPGMRQAGRPSRGSLFAFCARLPTTASYVPSDLAHLMVNPCSQTNINIKETGLCSLW